MELMEKKKTGFKKTELGSIPEDWEIIPIENEIDLLTGFPFASNKYEDSGVRLLRGSNVKRNCTDWNEDITQYWNKVTPELQKYLLKEGDIVIAMDGSLVGKSFAQLQKKDLPSLLLQRVARVRSQKIDINYLKEWICSKYFTEHSEKVKTSSAIPHISPKDIRDFQILVPPTLEEQKAIATALSDTDALIAGLEKFISKKKAIKQGTMQQLLTPPHKGGKRLPGFSGEWTKNQFINITNTITCGIAATPKYVNPNVGVPFLSSTNVKNGKIHWSNFKYIEKSLHRSLYLNNPPLVGDILYSRVGTIGEAAVVEDNREFSIYVSLTLIKPKDFIDSHFLMQLLNSKEYKGKAKAEVFLGGGVGNLNVDVVRKWEVYYPEKVEEQKAIAKVLADMNKELEALESKKTKYEQLKQGMMQELLTGKTRLV